MSYLCGLSVTFYTKSSDKSVFANANCEVRCGFFYEKPKNNPLFLLLPAEEVAQAVEVFLHDDAYALGVHGGTGEVAVVGLVVDLQGEVAVGK